MTKEKPKKIPKRIARIVGRCMAGEVLCKTLRRTETGGNEAAFFWYPSGAAAPAVSASKAIAEGYLVPNNDGLFGSETSQTWRAA